MGRIITLITDFGTADGYVGEVKGVLLTRARDASIVDIAHDIPPQDVESARLTLARAWRRFPVGTVHFVVVDPGVGSARLPLGVASDGRFLVGPDNGVLSPALLFPGAATVALEVGAQVSPTFHGRDVFAPAAAALALGEALESLGSPFATPIILRTPEPTRRVDGAVLGEVIHIDRFGNAVTNLLGLRGGVIELGERRLPVLHTYADVASGGALAVVGSTGFIEIAVRDGSAAADLQLARGDSVVLAPAPS
jgi:hypothetical protein